MKFDYLVKSGDTVLYEGRLAAEDKSTAQSVVLRKLGGRKVANLSISLNGEITLSQTKLFEPAYSYKLSKQPPRPW